METVSPNIFVHDLRATIAFYEKLEFNVQATVPDTGAELVWVMMTNGSVTFMFQTFDSIAGLHPGIRRENGGSLLLYIKMKGIRAFFERISQHVQPLTHLEKTFYGATEFSVADNNAYMLTFAEDE